MGTGALAACAAALALGLVIAPPDALQGETQRLMYVHVPAAWAAFAAFAAVSGAGAMRLWRGEGVWERLGRAAAELGAGMTALTIALGSLWGRPVWGVWWTWDPRLTATAAMLLVLLAYLALPYWPGGDPVRRARLTAATGVAGFAVVPVVHFSVLWWRTLHQPPTFLRPPGQVPVHPAMFAALIAAAVAFALMGAWVVLRRVRDLEPAPARAAEPAGESCGRVLVRSAA
ncbi:cytochrome c biogenesis protein CcsA [Sinosporangium siamense]|uniref:Heme exporter protein C n=1 Tax=Sinosporangium siamense TaxID=1367973 RepID=A0A919V9P4_9ACTN|nr:cytochrome c biogenesis protein CcsA [Sinosporangium siamense]GII94532.1 cytochrome C biogenesis protein CcmC [Sinosporangium siamense]